MSVKLIQYTYGDIDLFYTQEMIEEKQLFNNLAKEIACWTLVKHFIEDTKYQSIIEEHSKKNNLERISILSAHGDNVKKSWYYFNEDAGSSIQNWINKMDGKYKVLILDVCNPENNLIKSSKSIVLHPKSFISNRMLSLGEVPIQLFVPEKGYLNN